MRKATARHILVESQQQCEDIKIKLSEGADFTEMAQQYSLCPSGENGGDLGEFYPGQMVPEFDKVVFNEATGMVHGPVQTQFGYHLVEIISRTNS